MSDGSIALTNRFARGPSLAILCGVIVYLVGVSRVVAQPPALQDSGQQNRQLTLEMSVRFALENNPQLAAIRQQHGIAAASVVIAKTYPFNPIYQASVQYAKPPDQTAPNPVLNTHQITLEVQLFHQQRYRQQAAFAALTRTDWDIAEQELLAAVNAIRAFDGVLYRQQKLAVVDEFLRLNEKAAHQVGQLVERGTLKAGDLVLARTEVTDIQSQVGLSRTALTTANRDFYRALGVAEGNVQPNGTLERHSPPGDGEHWLAAAMELQPRLFSRTAAIEEAAADVRFQNADRFGNPQIGPFYELDQSRTSFVGAQILLPIPIFNRRPGEIQRAEATRTQAGLFLRQAEVEVKQDVVFAVARLTQAAEWVRSYRRDVLPALRKSLQNMEELFEQGQPGIDLLRVLDVRRKYLRAQDGYLDALLAYTSALADLAQAVGDPGLAIGQAAGALPIVPPPPQQVAPTGP